MSTEPFYRSRRWHALRLQALERDAHTCVVPGCRARATHVDHIVSRRAGGQDALTNLRSLCARHDGQVKERPDGKRGSAGRLHLVGCDVHGRPNDADHWWNAK